MFRQSSVIAILVWCSASAAASELDLLPLGDRERAAQLAFAPAGALFDTRSGDTIDLDELATRTAEARVVLVGEEHTAMEQKLFHERLLREVAGIG